MEQHRTRPPQRGPAPQATAAPVPPVAPVQGAFGESSTVYRAVGPAGGRVRAVPPVLLALRRFPDPRLTAIGAGLFASLSMFVLACLDRLLFDSSEIVYGLLFLLVSALTALWVRPADLVTAPISVPIAFALGIFPISGGAGGFGGRTMALVTALAVHAGWLYGGTLIAGLIATVRKVRCLRARRRYPLAEGRTGAEREEPEGRSAGRVPKKVSGAGAPAGRAERPRASR